MFDPDEQLLSLRRVSLRGDLTNESVTLACAQLMTLDGLSDQPIAVMMNAAGGGPAEVRVFLDTLDLLRAPVTVDVLGRAEGAAGVLVAAFPGKRTLGAAASISLRLVPNHASVAGHTATDVAQLVERSAADRALLAQRVAQRTGQTQEWVEGEFSSGAWHHGPAAVEFGLADQMRPPR